jgi:hypothetical protein
MKYFLDTEFIEGWKKPIKWLPTIGSFNAPYHSIQLVSISIVCEDGREYYAISNEYNPDDANYWVKVKVLAPIMRLNVPDKIRRQTHIDKLVRFKVHGAKSNYRIACDILEFIYDPDGLGLKEWLGFTDDYFTELRSMVVDEAVRPEFYADYADYDWVLFCSLFGSMADLPKSFPMYCKDLNQSLDELAKRKAKKDCISVDEALVLLKKDERFPKNENEHNALSDARYNFELYKFIGEFNKEETEMLFDELLVWQRQAFPDATSLSSALHLKEEVDELIVDIQTNVPDIRRRFEFADCFFLLYEAAALAGMTYRDILNCIGDKLEINKNRKWGKADKDGVVKHVE